MKRLVKGALLAAGTALAISAAPAMPAAAATSGTETLSGTIVFVGRAGYKYPDGHRQRGARRGVFRGVGRVVEVVPPDPAGVSRDDLVFRGGTMHVVSTAGTLLSELELAGQFEFPALPSVVSRTADNEQYHGARRRPENEQASQHPIGNVIDYGLARITWVEVNTYGLRRPEARDVKRIRLTLPPVVDESLLLGPGNLLAGPQHAVRYLQPRQHRQEGKDQKHDRRADEPASSVKPFAYPGEHTTQYAPPARWRPVTIQAEVWLFSPEPP
jgi:hypothetical protein